MKRLLGWMMLVCITTATSVFAGSLDAGLGAERSGLSLEQVAARSDRLEASTSFSLLRHPEALEAPNRIFRPEIWNHIQSAAREYDIDPMILAGMIFIESYGNPMAKSPTGPAGIAQMTQGSAKELGLAVGKKIRIGTKTVTETRWVGKGKNRRRVAKTVKQPVYRTLDERYIPAKAIAAMARRVSNRRAWLGGKLDFAIAEYHMGAGRMAKLLSTYFGRTIKPSDVTAEMTGTGLTYPELFWTNTPYYRPEVFEALDDLTSVDYSPTYYFRVRHAIRLLNIHRESPQEYARLASVYQGRFGWAVLPSAQWSFVSEPLPRALPAAPAGGPLHQDMSERFVLLPNIASAFGIRAGAEAMTAERSTIGTALFLAHHLRGLQGDRYAGFEITRMLDHGPGQEDHESFPLHTLGWAFDVTTKGMSRADRRDLKFILNDLRHAGLLAYVEDGDDPTYHIVRHPDYAAEFEQFYWNTMAETPPAGGPPQTVAAAGVAAAPADVPEVERGVRGRRLSGVLVALNRLLSKISSFFG